jgi:nucleoside 2-deoxyribosyltransferase
MPATPQSVSPVYMSGPMFSHADKKQQRDLTDVLETAGNMTCYLPERDGIEVGKLMKHANDPSGVPILSLYGAVQFLREVVFAMDMYQLLSRCNSLVLNLDGRVPDEGSVSETSAAWASGQAVVIFKTTPITMLGGFDNPMVDGLSVNWQPVWQGVTKAEQLPAAILAAADTMATFQPVRFTPGGQVAQVVKFGAYVGSQMQTIRDILDANPPLPPVQMITELIDLAKSWQQQLKAAYPSGPAVWLTPPPPPSK